MDAQSVSRRDFLCAAAGAGAAAIAAPAIGNVLGANDRLRFASIGVGGNACGRGTDHLNHLMEMSKDPRWNLRVDLVCDIYDKHLENSLRLANRDRAEGKCEGVKEWEKVVESKDIDCVVIATPDHWHAPMAIACMRSGKDVYLEKPMTLTIPEARDVHRTAVAGKRILQVGVQCTANGNIWGARDLVRKGILGKLLWSQTGYPRNSPGGEWNYPIQPEASPANIPWDRFLGSAPPREFSGERFFRWRKYWDYSGGIATDLYYHRLAPLHIIFGPEFPARAVAAGGTYIQKDGRDVPDTLMITLEYPSGHYVVMSSSMANDVGLPCIVRGNQATLFGLAATFDEARMPDHARTYYQKVIKFGRAEYGYVKEAQSGLEGLEKIPDPLP